MRLPNLSNATPRYAYARVRQELWQRRHPQAPWLTADAVGFLSQWLRRDDRGLEWGSGRSTAWFASHGARLVSVEHDSAWSERVLRLLHERDLTDRVDYRTLPDGAAESSDTEYVGVADSIRDESLDFVLVDGVSREHCALSAISKLRRGGILIVDNIDWFLPSNSRGPHALRPDAEPATEGWARFAAETRNWNRVWTTNGVWDTAFFFRP